MKRINILIPYFGNLPNYFQLFLNSCAYNSTVNWTIFTDCTKEYVFPKNVQVVYTTFGKVQEIIKNAFDFSPVIDSVHKLCEYKPAYGYLFPEYIKGYDYWGYGDIDLIYGDIRAFLSEEILDYDKVFQLGHLSLIKNNKINNEMFMSMISGRLLYKEAFSSSGNYNFDEHFFDRLNINSLFEEHKKLVWKQSFAADIYTKSSDFVLDTGDGKCEKKKKSLFLWNRGKLCRYYKGADELVKCEEYIYIHLQKRKMQIKVNDNAICYKIIPNEFACLEIDPQSIDVGFDRVCLKKRNKQYFAIRYKNLVVKLKHFLRWGDQL